jgi:hypothetical protein
MKWWDRDRATATALSAQTAMNRRDEAVLNPYKEAIFSHGRAIKNAACYLRNWHYCAVVTRRCTPQLAVIR